MAQEFGRYPEFYYLLSVHVCQIMSDDADFDEALGRVAQRIEFLELLQERRLKTKQIVEQLDHSRSTVSRALRQLQNTELIEKTEDGYTATPHGALLAGQYLQYAEEAQSIHDARDLLESLPESEKIDWPFVAKSRVVESDDAPPFRPLEAISNQLSNNQRVCAYVPTLSGPHLLRVLHEIVVEQGCSLELLVSQRLCDSLRSYYPGFVSKMVSVGDCTIAAVDGPTYGMFLALANGQREAALTVHSEGGAIQGGLFSDEQLAVNWAVDRIDEFQSSAVDRTDEFRNAPTSTNELTPISEEKLGFEDGQPESSLPLDLRAEGFQRLSRENVQGESQLDPEAALRVGLSLEDIRSGLAIERTVDVEDGSRPVRHELVDRLKRGDNTVLLGPPGSGKSTICKSVAIEWLENEHGPVVYREAEAGTPFESQGMLEAYLERMDGHTLVVVEDVMRQESRAVFPVIEAFAGDTDVTFLVDSRESEWDDPDEPFADARADSVRRELMAKFQVPELDVEEAQQLVQAVEESAEGSLDLSGREVIEHIGDPDRRGDSNSPGSLFLSQQLLLSRINSFGEYDTSASNSFEEDVLRWYNRFIDSEDECLGDISIMINILNAAGLPIAPELIYALESRYDIERISRGVDDAFGALLFETVETEFGIEYRTNHELWSVEFLKRVLESEGNPVRRFERCVQPLFSLLDDSEKQSRIADSLTHGVPYLNQMNANPSRWSDILVTRLFRLGLNYSRLASLFGTAAESNLHFPDRCRSGVVARTRYWRAQMYRFDGQYDIALAEFEGTRKYLGKASGLRSRERNQIIFDCLTGQGAIHSDRGEIEQAKELAERALEIAEETGNDGMEAVVWLRYGHLGYKQSEYDSALERYDRSIDAARAADDRQTLARALTASGAVREEQGGYEDAEKRYNRALERSREIGDRRNEANTIGNLGVLARDQNDFETARQRFREKLHLCREIGERRSEANALWNLGSVDSEQEQLDSATKHVRKALELSREAGIRRIEAESLHLLGSIERRRENSTDARQYALKAIEVFEAIGFRYGVGEAYRELARTEMGIGNMETARRYVAKSEMISKELDAQTGIAQCNELSARISYMDGDLSQSRKFAESAADAYRTTGDKRGLAETLRILGEIEIGRGNYSQGHELLADGLENAEESSVERTINRVQHSVEQAEGEKV